MRSGLRRFRGEMLGPGRQLWVARGFCLDQVSDVSDVIIHSMGTHVSFIFMELQPAHIFKAQINFHFSHGPLNGPRVWGVIPGKARHQPVALKINTSGLWLGGVDDSKVWQDFHQSILVGDEWPISASGPSFRLLGIIYSTYLIGKQKFKFVFHGPLAEWDDVFSLALQREGDV